MNENYDRDALISALRNSISTLEQEEQMADEILRELEEKSDIEVFRTPKTPMYKMVYGKRLLSEAFCPECGNTVFRNDDYCSKCGQAIDWTEVEIQEAENDRPENV